MKNIRWKFIFISFCSLLILESCNVIDEIKRELYVKIETSEIRPSSYTQVIAGGNITDDGGKPITERGVCYSTNPNPTTGNSKQIIGAGSGAFSTWVSNLKANTTYYFRAYCINSLGTTYGNEVTTKTPDYVLANFPILPVAINVSETYIDLKGTMNTSEVPLIDYGFCYSENPLPTINNFKSSSNDLKSQVFGGPVYDVFTTRLIGFKSNTNYYIRAYCTNIKGTSYSDQIIIKTPQSWIEIGLKSGLQVFYSFDGNANDVSGNQKHGTVYNAKLVSDRFGTTNSAYSFDGVAGTKIQTTYPGVLGNNSRSISIWSRRPQQAFNGSFLLTWGTQVQGASFGLYMAGRDKTQFFGVDNGGSSAQTIFNSLWDGNWHHYVVVYDKNVGQNILNIKLYIDGKFYPINENWNPQNINTVQGINMVIGEYSAAQNDYRTTNGELDDLGVWNRALTEAEIQYLYLNNYKP